MKKFYMIMAVAAAMAMNAQAQVVTNDYVDVGDFENASEYYNGSFFDMAPTNFYLAHTGAQMIYTTDMLAELQDKNDVQITGFKFKFFDEGVYEDIVRDVKIFLEATDAAEFAEIKGVKQFFTFDNLVTEVHTKTYDMLGTLYEDVEDEFVLDVPFALEAGKNLLVTIVYDAIDDDNCSTGSDYAPFYTSGIRGHAMTYTDNWTSFLDYAQGNDFPDATSVLGCGTNVELPVTRITYSYTDQRSSVNEIEAAQVNDNVYYNLMGQKVDAGHLSSGIYIHNGQKVIIK